MARGVSEHPVISADVVASYAAAAAAEVEGVVRIVDGSVRRGVRVALADRTSPLTVELRLEVAWGGDAAEIGCRVQERVAEYLRRMVAAPAVKVDVTVDAVAAAAAE